MKTYEIYNMQTNELLGEVQAYGVIEAERLAIKELGLTIDSSDVAAFTKNKDAVFIEATRAAYGPDQVRQTFTVGDLISLLSEYDEDTEVFIQNDNGYTFGGLWFDSITLGEYNDNGECCIDGQIG